MAPLPSPSPCILRSIPYTIAIDWSMHQAQSIYWLEKSTNSFLFFLLFLSFGAVSNSTLTLDIQAFELCMNESYVTFRVLLHSSCFAFGPSFLLCRVAPCLLVVSQICHIDTSMPCCTSLPRCLVSLSFFVLLSDLCSEKALFPILALSQLYTVHTSTHSTAANSHFCTSYSGTLFIHSHAHTPHTPHTPHTRTLFALITPSSQRLCHLALLHFFIYRSRSHFSAVTVASPTFFSLFPPLCAFAFAYSSFLSSSPSRSILCTIHPYILALTLTYILTLVNSLHKPHSQPHISYII